MFHASGQKHWLSHESVLFKHLFEKFKVECLGRVENANPQAILGTTIAPQHSLEALSILPEGFTIELNILTGQNLTAAPLFEEGLALRNSATPDVNILIVVPSRLSR